jgi:hypothetical protein
VKVTQESIAAFSSGNLRPTAFKSAVGWGQRTSLRHGPHELYFWKVAQTLGIGPTLETRSIGIQRVAVAVAVGVGVGVAVGEVKPWRKHPELESGDGRCSTYE